MDFSKLVVLILLLINNRGYAQTPFKLNLQSDPQTQCEPQDPNATNQFACCVKLAISLELDQQKNLHLIADKNICINPILQNMKFTLKTARLDGVLIFELSYPTLQQTPFKSYSVNPARFWIAINSYFNLPKQTFLKNDVHPFVIAPLRVEQLKPDGSSKFTFETELSSIFGWKYLSEEITSEEFENYDCSNPFQRNKTCTERTQTIEQSWLNQLTLMILKRNVEVQELISMD